MSTPPLTWSTLQEKTGITNKELQKNVEKEDINNLAEHFGSWRIFVYKPGFNLSETKITDVQDMANRYNNKIAISTALRIWLNKNPWETNRSLLKITMDCKEGTLTVELAKISELFHTML